MNTWFNKAKQFLYEVWLEAKPGGRVNWPDTQKLMESTALVMLCALFFMLYIGVLDVVFEYLISTLTEIARG
ncbi:MAG: preprotein translocase subunit SecE [bacterium]